jgi:Holliday junction resolvasome RuvABC ATP-dependent DNA helicase subunit
MSIIIEGMDNSGKSTLGEFIGEKLGYYIQDSEGPPINQAEILLRLERYRRMHDTLFIRHPIVSNPIYDSARPPE